MQSQKIVAFDLATNTGVCVGQGTELDKLYSLKFDGKGGLGLFLIEATGKIHKVLSDEKPDMVFFESPVLPRTTSIATTRKLQGLAGILEMLCYKHRIRVFEATTTEIKLNLSGHGLANKDDQILSAKMMGANPETSDEADAFAIFITAIKRFNPQAWEYWCSLQQTPEFKEHLVTLKALIKKRRADKKAAKEAKEQE